MRRRLAIFWIGLALFLFAVPALAWVFEIPFSARVNGHQFDRVRAEANGCALTVKLSFDAGEDEYKSKAKNRNYHRFRARIVFKDGKTVVTPVFFNRAPGRRVYTYRTDTTGNGCWSKEKTQVRDVDIEGCRAKGCQVEEFKD